MDQGLAVMILLSFLIGLAAGYLSGLLGIGAGVIMVPSAMYLLHMEFTEAKSISLFVIMFSSCVGMLRFSFHGKLDARTGLMLGIPGAGGSFLGVYVAGIMDVTHLKVLFALVLFFTGIRLILSGRSERQVSRGSGTPAPVGSLCARSSPDGHIQAPGDITGAGSADGPIQAPGGGTGPGSSGGSTMGSSDGLTLPAPGHALRCTPDGPSDGSRQGGAGIGPDDLMPHDRSPENEPALPPPGSEPPSHPPAGTEVFIHNRRVLPFIGFSGGFLAGLLGIGGGVIMVPAMIVLGYPVHAAVANSLMVVFLNATAGTAAHAYRGEIFLFQAAPLMLGAVISVRKGVDMSVSMNRDLLRKMFGYFMILIGIYMVLRSLFS